MNITLNQDEIQTACINYVQSLGLDLGDRVLSVDFTSTRNPSALSAAIEIKPLEVATTTEKTLSEVVVIKAAASILEVPETPEVTEEVTTAPDEDPLAKFDGFGNDSVDDDLEAFKTA